MPPLILMDFLSTVSLITPSELPLFKMRSIFLHAQIRSSRHVECYIFFWDSTKSLHLILYYFKGMLPIKTFKSFYLVLLKTAPLQRNTSNDMQIDFSAMHCLRTVNALSKFHVVLAISFLQQQWTQ